MKILLKKFLNVFFKIWQTKSYVYLNIHKEKMLHYLKDLALVSTFFNMKMLLMQCNLKTPNRSERIKYGGLIINFQRTAVIRSSSLFTFCSFLWVKWPASRVITQNRNKHTISLIFKHPNYHWFKYLQKKGIKMASIHERVCIQVTHIWFDSFKHFSHKGFSSMTEWLTYSFVSVVWSIHQILSTNHYDPYFVLSFFSYKHILTLKHVRGTLSLQQSQNRRQFM